MKLYYTQQPPKEILDIYDFPSWESNALPLGNGYFGAAAFGRIQRDRIQITENSLCNPYAFDEKAKSRNFGLQSMCDLFFEFQEENADEYQRELDLETGSVVVSYSANGTRYQREIFTSYPDRVLVVKLTADRANSINVKINLSLPFIGKRITQDGKDFSRTGTVESFEGLTIGHGTLAYYGVDYVAGYTLIQEGGEKRIDVAGQTIENATSVTLIFSCLTNYELNSKVFLEKDPKKKLNKDIDLLQKVKEVIADAVEKGFEELKRRHVEDYQSLFGRVSLTFGESKKLIPTNELVEQAKEGRCSTKLQELLFHYGRYLLISSSRPGGLPANLQGIWSAYDSSPWSAGYWHNINIQMNHWPSGPANLAETFLPYAEYFKSYCPQAKLLANEYIQKVAPEKHTDDDGWIIGTGGWPFAIEGLDPSSHSGPGTGAFTSILFYDHYAFTGDVNFLKTTAWPALRGMSTFLEKNLVPVDGKMLIQNSASPENIEAGGEWNDYHHTVGCAFDQQMVAENFSKTIEAAKALGIQNDPLVEKINVALPYLEPVIIGESGQVKEYREERFYGDIGEKHHRHISQLVGLYPGTTISLDTPKELEAAKYTLNARGDESTGWATAHRLCLWARTGDGKRAYDLIQSFCARNVLPNLWDSHPPFQIDGNLGFVAGVCEMLLQSQSQNIRLLPCLPKEWKNGSFSGLKARGDFTISCNWENGHVVSGSIHCGHDGTLRIRKEGFSMFDAKGKEIQPINGIFIVPSKAGDIFRLKQEE